MTDEEKLRAEAKLVADQKKMELDAQKRQTEQLAEQRMQFESSERANATTAFEHLRASWSATRTAAAGRPGVRFVALAWVRGETASQLGNEFCEELLKGGASASLRSLRFVQGGVSMPPESVGRQEATLDMDGDGTCWCPRGTPIIGPRGGQPSAWLVIDW